MQCNSRSAAHPLSRPLIVVDVRTDDASHLSHIEAYKVHAQGREDHFATSILPALQRPTPTSEVPLAHAAADFARFAHQCDVVGRNGGATITQALARAGFELPLAAADITDVIAEIMEHDATFTAADLSRNVAGRLPHDSYVAPIVRNLLNDAMVVHLGADENGVERFTTAEMLATERRLLELTRSLAKSHSHALALAHLAAAPTATALNDEQKQAFRYVTAQTGDLAIVAGYAGVGKSFMLRAAREAWAAAGLRVQGAAVAGKAAEELQTLSGIGSSTVASWEYNWRFGKKRLGPQDILVVDEASMVGTRMMTRLLQHAAEHGAKVVLLGDVEQLPAIEAGAPLRAMGELVGQISLEHICRQQAPWMRDATLLLARRRTREALTQYQKAGHIHGHPTHAAALQAVAAAWEAHRTAAPEQTQIMLAYRRADVYALNQHARLLLAARGELQHEIHLMTARGERAFAVGDRLYFLRNDRGIGVRNGTLGKIEGIEGSILTVRLDGANTAVTVDLRTYPHVDHGYAATVHKAQGVTVDRCHVVASELFDRHVTYVALSRHRGTVDLHWGEDVFSNIDALFSALERAQPKDLALDYLPACGPGIS